MGTNDIFVVSVYHTQRRDPYITFWRPKDSGYCWPLSWAGVYDRTAVEEALSYYNDGERNIAVSAEVARSISEPPEPGRVDGNAGPVVRNNAANWRKLLGAVIALPEHTPRPEFHKGRAAA